MALRVLPPLSLPLVRWQSDIQPRWVLIQLWLRLPHHWPTTTLTRSTATAMPCRML
uniref:Uncharacterized protein n=1 Tax=Anopheles funestus TaxID=62324 RepID=A0A4Y0BNC4_ANOFN